MRSCALKFNRFQLFCFPNFCSLPTEAAVRLRLRLSWTLLSWIPVRTVQLLINYQHHPTMTCKRSYKKLFGLLYYFLFFFSITKYCRQYFSPLQSTRRQFFKKRNTKTSLLTFFFKIVSRVDLIQSLRCTYERKKCFHHSKAFSHFFHVCDLNFFINI